MVFSVLRIWPIFGSVFRFKHFKTAGALRGLRFFSNLVFGFRFWSTMMAVFRIFMASALHGFSGFAKEVTPCSRAKAVIPRHQSQLEECMASLVSLAAVVWVVTGCQAD